jgi:hypothetical protein
MDSMLRRGGPVDPAVEEAAGPRRRWLHYARLLLRVLPFLALVFGLVYDGLTPPDVTPVPFFAAAPLIAAPLYTLRATVLIGVLSVLCTLTVRLTRDEFYPAQVATELFTVFTVGVLAGVVNTVVRRGDLRLANARQMAEAAQRAVMPVPERELGALRIASRYEAAQQEANLGGDLYVVQDTPYGVRVILGDVRGKGMTAVTAVAIVVGVFREVAERAPTIEECALRLDQAVVRERDRRGQDLERAEGFVTAVFAEFSRDGRTLRLVDHGHPPPLLLEPGRKPRLLEVGEPGGPLALSDLAGLGSNCGREPPSSSTRTASPRPATTTGCSTTRSSGSTAGSSASRRTCWTSCPRMWPCMPGATWRTTWHCSPSAAGKRAPAPVGRPRQRRRHDRAAMIKP